MGANTANRGNMNAARQRPEMERQAMRSRDMEQQAARQRQEMESQTMRNRDMEQQAARQRQEMENQTMRNRDMEQRARATPPPRASAPLPSGVNLGPGRANRIPEQGSREYQQLIGQVRGLGRR